MTNLKSSKVLALCVFLGSAAIGQANVVTDWNALAAQCISAATPPGRGGPPSFLDMAIVQAAVHDAVQAIDKDFEPYLATPAATGRESRSAAAAAAAHDVLVVLCPAAVATLDAAYKPYKDGMDPGLAVGSAAAATLLTKRRPTPVIPDFNGGTGIGEWRPTPLLFQPLQFLFMATTEPFTLEAPDQFRPDGPPSIDSRKYVRDYNEVKNIGAVESHPAVGACPAPRQTDLARFWSGNYTVLWNEAVRNIAIDRQLSTGDTARLLALASFVMADAAIAVWDSKFIFNFWRPITAVREGDNDNNPLTDGDPAWTPFIQSVHFPSGAQTPAYPDYTSGANGVTGAITKLLQLYFDTDKFSFEIHKATPPTVAICTNPRLFSRFSDAAEEVEDARVLLGIHFRFADEDARRLGGQVAAWTFNEFLRPIRKHGKH